ncbi:MAG: ATP-dependent DNA helicase [Planctomycetaceae bacterium]|nr:ATP-dependent DNA helicase [Planctomycetaceae bacterium]
MKAVAGIDEVLGELNSQQRSAASHGLSPLLIVAGAGTGKTSTLTHRVAYHIAQGVDPGRILLLTFTRRAAAEMLRRVDSILTQLGKQDATAQGRISSRRIWGGTFHAIGSRLLRQCAKSINLSPEFSILDRSDAEDLLNLARSDLGFAKEIKRFPLKGTCLSIYSRCVNSQTSVEHVLKTAYPWCQDFETQLKQLFKAYTDRKEAQNCLDYDDLLLFWDAMMSNEAAASIVREKFDCILVDEYQDTNLLQSSILKGLSPDGQGVTVVGDDAQSIYSFRAATVRNILDFPKQYQGTTVITLEENYRSTQPILNATNAVIALSSERHEKNLWSQRENGPPPVMVDCYDEEEQSHYIIDRVLERREQGVPLMNQSVLFRASHHSLELEISLAERNIPFHKYGGLKFIEAAHIKDLMAFMRLAENPRDTVATLRTLLLIPGIGPIRARKISNDLIEADGRIDVLEKMKPPKAAAEEWPAFVELMKLLMKRTGKKTEVAEELHAIRKFYAPLLELKHDNARMRLRDLEQLEQIASRYQDRNTFLTQMTLDPPSSTQDLAGDPHLDEDYLTLSTIHSAKGLEWDSVYVLHAADGNIPSDMATEDESQIEEERRLFYVALTRAKQHLYVMFPQRYYFRRNSDRHSFAQLTRFLPPDTLRHFERRTAEGSADTAESIDGPTLDVRSQIKSMWD